MKALTQRTFIAGGVVFTLADALMTAFFGWMWASEAFLKPVYFGALGAGSFILALFPVAIVAMLLKRHWVFYCLAGFIVLIYAGGFVLNFFSNYGLSAAIAKGNIIAAENKNIKHSDVRDRIGRLRADIKELSGKIDFTPGIKLSDRKDKVWFSSPNGYDKLIAAYRKKAKNEEEKRGGCGIKCEDFHADVGNLIGAQQNAFQRTANIAERRQKQQELKDAEALSKEAPKTISVAFSQAQYLSRMWHGTLSPDQKVTDWTLIYIAVGISLMISVFAHVCNLIAALNLAGIEAEEEQPRYARNEWIPDARAAEGRYVAPGTSVQEGQEKVYVLQSETIKEKGESTIQVEAMLNTLKKLDERFNPKGTTA